MKVPITKEQYDDVMLAEKSTGKKAKNVLIAVAECVNGVHGVYQIIGCTKSLNRYIGDLKLLERANDKQDAVARTFLYIKRAQNHLLQKENSKKTH